VRPCDCGQAQIPLDTHARRSCVHRRWLLIAQNRGQGVVVMVSVDAYDSLLKRVVGQFSGTSCVAIQPVFTRAFGFPSIL